MCHVKKHVYFSGMKDKKLPHELAELSDRPRFKINMAFVPKGYVCRLNASLKLSSYFYDTLISGVVLVLLVKNSDIYIWEKNIVCVWRDAVLPLPTLLLCLSCGQLSSPSSRSLFVIFSFSSLVIFSIAPPPPSPKGLTHNFYTHSPHAVSLWICQHQDDTQSIFYKASI